MKIELEKKEIKYLKQLLNEQRYAVEFSKEPEFANETERIKAILRKLK